jgi:enamine deaminase RidA (YjgF/YER057c/UK114 family)
MLGIGGGRLPRRHAWPSGHWDWPIHLPYKHGVECEGMIFIGGQVALTATGEVIDPGRLLEQTRISIHNIARVLRELGRSIGEVVKITTFYRSSAAPADLQVILAECTKAFANAAPAVTLIPLPYLAYDGTLVEIEAIAMT